MSDTYHIEDDASERGYDARLMGRLLAYVKPYARSLFFSVILLLGATLASTLIPYLDMKAIDWYINSPDRVALRQSMAASATPEQQATLTQMVQRDWDGLLQLIWIILGLMLIEAVCRYSQAMLVSWLGQRTMLEMRVQVFAHLQRMSQRYLDKNPIGRLMTRVTNDIEKIQETIISGMVQVVGDLVTMIVVLIFMTWVNWRLTLIALTPIPFVFITSAIFRKYARASYLEIRKRLANLNSFMQESLSGMRVVQMFGRETPVYEQYDVRNKDHRDEWFRQVKYYAYYFPIVDFLGTLSLALIILYGGRQIMGAQSSGIGTATVGMFFAYVQWSERLYGPIRALVDRYNLLLEAMASSDRVFELLDTVEDVADKPDAILAGRLRGEVEFRDVWFAYEPEQWVLKGVSFKIQEGERVAIVGHTGAGKTTFINILSRFYDVQKGAVLVDGVDVRDYEQVSFRKQIGTVLQDVFLFSGSVEHNIRLGLESMPTERIHSAAANVNAAGFIEKLPGTYGYDVGERGTNLSTGQRQLLAFARTLAHEPSILVLDEATSSIDTETELLIQDAIGKLMQGRTSIVIAHRLSTVQKADRIIVMHHGEIVETGTHQELLALRGLYFRLYELQYKDQALGRSPFKLFEGI